MAGRASELIAEWLEAAKPWPLEEEEAAALAALERRRPGSGATSEKAFSAQLLLFMACDPWPAGAPAQDVVEAILNLEAEHRGYLDWLDAWRRRFMQPGDHERVATPTGDRRKAESAASELLDRLRRR